MQKSNKQAFTLIELLVVIAIIGILSGLIIVSMNGATNSANDAKRKANLDTIRKALIVYGTLNGNTYPTGTPEASGCNIGPVGIANRCTNLASALSELLPILPVDPVSGYYIYVSNGTDFNLYSVLSSGSYSGYSRSGGYYTSIIAKSAYGNSSRNRVYGTAYLNDSANGALGSYVSNFSAGWSGTTYVGSAYGFQAGTYQIYIRVRTDGLGNYPTSFSTAGLWNNTTATTFAGYTVTGLTTSYQLKYIGSFTLTEALLSNNIYTWFSNSATTTNYYIDYVEFRLVP